MLHDAESGDRSVNHVRGRSADRRADRLRQWNAVVATALYEELLLGDVVHRAIAFAAADSVARAEVRVRRVATPTVRTAVDFLLAHIGPESAYHIIAGSTFRPTPRSLSMPADAFSAPSVRGVAAGRRPSEPVRRVFSMRCTTRSPERSACAHQPRRARSASEFLPYRRT